MSELRNERLRWWLALLLAGVVYAGAALAQSEPSQSPTTAPAAKPLEMVYVFSPTCLKCKEASKLIDAAVVRYGVQIHVQRLNVQDPNDLERVMAQEERCHAPAAAPPRVFIGSRYLTGLEAITAHLDATIVQELKALATPQGGR